MGFTAELIEKAKAAGVNHEDFKDEESLTKAITEKTKKKDDDVEVKDLDSAKEEIKKFREEAKKAFEARDEAKKKIRALTAEIDETKAKIKDSPSKEEYDNLKKQLDELAEFKKEYDTKIEEDTLKNKTEAEKLKIRFEKEFERLKKEMDEATVKVKRAVEEKEKELQTKDKEVENLRRHRLRAEIMEYATKMKAYNPAQVARLLIDEFTYDKGLDTFYFHKKDSKGKITDELDIEERVKEFLGDPENDNLVEATVRRGITHNKSDTRGKVDTDTTDDTDGEKKYDPHDPKIIAEADLKGLTVEDHIRILRLRDKKLSKMKVKK